MSLYSYFPIRKGLTKNNLKHDILIEILYIIISMTNVVTI